LSPLPRARAGRPLRRVQDLWPKAGDVLIAEGIRLNTQRVVAFSIEQKALSNVWWPLAMRSSDPKKSKALVLWLNSTLGLVTMLANREETEGAWVSFKKPVLAAMPVLDVERLSGDRLDILSSCFDEIRSDNLSPFPNMDGDHVRQQIDDAISRALDLHDLAPVRRTLAREPIICLQPL
jgi:hypothetical protein